MKYLMVFLIFFMLVNCSTNENTDTALNHNLPPIPLNIDDQSFDVIVKKQFQQRIEYINLIKKNNTKKSKLGWAIGQLGKTYHAYLMENQAKDCYINAIAEQPNNHQWYYLLAHVYRQIGDFDEALKYFNHPINHTHLPAQIWQVDVLLQTNQLAQAQKLNQRILTNHPSQPMALYHMALIERQLGNEDTAITYFQKVLQQQPQAYQAHYQLGQIYAKNGQAELAQQHFLKAPDDSDLRTSITFDDALMQNVSDLNRGIQKTIKKAIKASKKGHHLQALNLLKKISQADPSRINIQYNMAIVYAKMGNKTEAQNTLEPLTDLQNDKVFALMATIHKSNGKNDLAIEQLQKAIVLNPQSSEYAIRLADLYHQQQQYKAAIEHYNNAIEFGGIIESTPLKLARTLLQTNHSEVETITVLQNINRQSPYQNTKNNMLARIMAQSEGHCPDALMVKIASQQTVMAHETKAMCAVWQGDFSQAIVHQQKAWDDIQKNTSKKSEINRVADRLNAYQKKQTTDSIWLHDEPLS